uniref:Uncharacterized protein n=1 Tax=Oryza meridionalis TaxID=40149 RepID=A0A0E0DH05_9ORYZ
MAHIVGGGFTARFDKNGWFLYFADVEEAHTTIVLMRGGTRRSRSTIVVVEDDHGVGDGFPEDDLGPGDGFTEDDLEAAEQLMQLRRSGGRQEEQTDEDDDGDRFGRKRKHPRFRSLSEL